MFAIWRLRRQLRKFERISEHRFKAFQKWRDDERMDTPMPEFEELPYDEVRERIELIIGNRLLVEAQALDIEIPWHADDGTWIKKEELGKIPPYLSPKGRATLRKLVDAEKARRFEV